MPTSDDLPLEELQPRGESQTGMALEPLYHVILFDDDEHTYRYVVDMLVKLFGKTPEEAYNIAYEVDYLGQAVVVTCPMDEAIAGRDSILSYGADPDLVHSAGSMKAIVVEAVE